MDDYEVSKWEPDPISTPSATIQNAVLNPEETSVSKFSKPKDGDNGFRSNQNKALVVS